jgi:dienelactone hydrolase
MQKCFTHYGGILMQIINENIMVESIKIKNIPVKMYYKKDKKTRGIIFALHGYTSNKESLENDLKICSRLAEKDFCVVTFDAYKHGERRDKDISSLNGIHRNEMIFKIIVHTNSDINYIIEYLSTETEFDTNNIGLTGISLGGLATFYYIANNNKIKVAVPIVGAPCFEEFAIDKLKSIGMYDVAKNDGLKEKLDLLKSIDPKNSLFNFAPKPLIMLCGKYDSTVPYKYCETMYQELKPHYKDCPNSLIFKLFEANHVENFEMVEDMIKHFNDNL